MTRVKISGIPRIKKFKPLYSKKITVEAIEKIDYIANVLGVSKWRVIDKVICSGLKVESENVLNLKKWGIK